MRDRLTARSWIALDGGRCRRGSLESMYDRASARGSDNRMRLLSGAAGGAPYGLCSAGGREQLCRNRGRSRGTARGSRLVAGPFRRPHNAGRQGCGKHRGMP